MGILDTLRRKYTARLRVNPVKNHLSHPVASFSFDDFPSTAWRNGGKILEKYNAKGTYYAVGEFCGQTVDGIKQYTLDDIRAAHANGHEIGSHTYVHRSVHYMNDAEIEAQEKQNQEFFKNALDGYVLETFAYPFGDISPRTKNLYSSIYRTNRGITFGLNGANGGDIDTSQLMAVNIETRNYDKARIEKIIAKAKVTNAWIVFFSHEIEDSPGKYGATPQMLEDTIKAVIASDIEIMTVAQGFQKAQHN